ncbi:MAG: hypothetical protein WCR36_03105 [Bacteroidaceae bacterium]
MNKQFNKDIIANQVNQMNSSGIVNFVRTLSIIYTVNVANSKELCKQIRTI